MSYPSLPSAVANPLKLLWDIRKHGTFEVEITEKGDDIVYHFWPHGKDLDFPPHFRIELQDVFRAAFERQPKDEEGFPKVDVQAEYTSYEDAKVMFDHDGVVPVKADYPADLAPTPLATFYVKVVGWASNPMSDQLLKDQLLSRLDSQVKAHAPQEDPLERQPDDEPQRRDPRRGRRRRRK